MKSEKWIISDRIIFNRINFSLLLLLKSRFSFIIYIWKCLEYLSGNKDSFIKIKVNQKLPSKTSSLSDLMIENYFQQEIYLNFKDYSNSKTLNLFKTPEFIWLSYLFFFVVVDAVEDFVSK